MTLTDTQVVELLEPLEPQFAHTIASLAVAFANADNPLELWAKARGDEEPPQGLAELTPKAKADPQDTEDTKDAKDKSLTYPSHWPINGQFKK